MTTEEKQLFLIEKLLNLEGLPLCRVMEPEDLMHLSDEELDFLVMRFKEVSEDDRAA